MPRPCCLCTLRKTIERRAAGQDLLPQNELNLTYCNSCCYVSCSVGADVSDLLSHILLL